jgi:excinuclease ABC subunit C
VVTVATRTLVSLLPAGPGVYRFHDASGRVLYIGRAVNLRRRVGSYWGDLGDRPHLSAMVRQIAGLDAVSCASEHEAAWLERNLLEAAIPRWNRTPGGQEVEVCVRLDRSARSPGLSVVHAGAGSGPGSAGPQVSYFGPYLGGARVRLAIAGLHRVWPLGYAADWRRGAVGELAACRGINAADREQLACALAAVLARDHAAVAAARADLAARRDAAAGAEAFELAGRIQAELVALEWITCPQRVASLACEDAVVAGWAGGVLVIFEVTGGRMRRWRRLERTSEQARRWLAATPPRWQSFARQNAQLAARLQSHPDVGARRVGARRVGARRRA